MRNDNLEQLSMRTLFVHDRFGGLAGPEANILLTAGELRRRGHMVGILHGPGTGRSESQWCEIFSRCFALAKNRGLDSVQSALWEFGPDLIYLHNVPHAQIMAMLLASGIPVVRMVHNDDLSCRRRHKYTLLTRRICRRAASRVSACRTFLSRNRKGFFSGKWTSHFAGRRETHLNQKCDRLIVASHSMRLELVQDRCQPEKIEVLPPLPQRGTTAVRSNFGSRNLLVFAGQIIRGKGLDVLLESLVRVKVPFECVILGDGSHRTYCEQLSRSLGLEDRVSFKGYAPQPDINEYYREASLALLSSVWPEPFGTMGLDGMRHGLPLVAFNAGGVNEWLIDGYNGCLVPWMDKAAFATRVEQLLLDKSRARKLGENALKLVSKRLDFSDYIDRLESIFEEVLTEIRERAPI
jgi:glycosyltransferase involved in cell wall biosynthesis